MPSLPIAYEDVGNWQAEGWPRWLDFWALTEEVQGWLLGGLPPEYEPYELITVGAASVDGREVALTTRRLVDDLRGGVGDVPERAPDSGGASLFIASAKLTPAQSFASVEDADAFCRLNGMPRLAAHPCAWWSLEMTEAARHASTGEVRRRDDYLDVFRRLESVVKAALTHTIWYREAPEWVEVDVPVATEGATRLIGRMDDMHLPGRRVR